MKIELLNGTSFDIADYGLTRLFHHIPSAEISHTTSSVDGKGEIITGSVLLNRTISVELLFRTYDIRDYYMLRDELNGLFARTEPFYITFKREPYKRWKVRLASGFAIPPKPRMGAFTVEFITVDKYAESVGTSLQLAEQDFDSGLWGFGSIIDVDKQYQYRFTSNSFTVENIGNVTIDPCEHFLEITIKATAAQYLQIRNQTTGEIYRFNGALPSTSNLVISGVQSKLNGASVFARTNGNLLSLAAGANRFIVEGGTVASIQFKFKFLYK